MIFYKLDTLAVKDGVPAGWLVEYNSDLKGTNLLPGDAKISLSAYGNKYIPISPEAVDGLLKMKIGFNLALAKRCEVMLPFRYDVVKRKGETVRFLYEQGRNELRLEYGFMNDNVFEVKESVPFSVTDEEFSKPVEASVTLAGGKVEISFASASANFRTLPPKPGRFAICRGVFLDLLDIYEFELEIPRGIVVNEKQYSIDLPYVSDYPIHCAVHLLEYSDCAEAEFTFTGGVPATEPG